MKQDKPNPMVNLQGRLGLYVLGIGLLLWELAKTVRDYFVGGPEGPTLTQLLVNLVVLGGGSLVALFFIYRMWKEDQQNKAEEAEALAAMEEAETYEEQVNAELEYQMAVEEFEEDSEEFSAEDGEEDETDSFSDSVE